MTEESAIVGARDGKLVVVSTAESFADRHAIRAGNQLISFSRRDAPASPLLIGVNLLAPDVEGERSATWAVESTDGVALTKNINREWLVDNDNTWTLAAPRHARNVSVTYVDPALGALLPAQPGMTYEASGLFAAHQALGELRLSAVDAHGTVVAAGTAQITNDARGGRHPEDYRECVVRLQAPATAVALKFEVVFVKHVVERSAESDAAFLFFGHCRLVSSPDRGAAWVPPSYAVPVLMQVAAGHGRGQLFEAPVELGEATGVSEVQLVATDGSSEGPIAKYAVPDLDPRGKAFIRGFSGNSVKLRILGHAAALALYIDGERVGQTNPVRPKKAEDWRGASVAVAQRFCDGNVHVLELRDVTGIHLLARSAELLPSVLTPWGALQTYSSHPLPYHLAPAASHRYRALRRNLDRFSEKVATDGLTEEEATQHAQLAWTHHVLEVGFEKVKDFRPLHFPKVEEPEVSVVIPVHNKFNVTYHCLAALLLASNDVSFEVVIVDDGSNDETLDLAEIAPNVTICRNEVAQGFVRACNLGVENARGEYVVLLNNDTEPTVGWLDALVDALGRFESAGLVGSKLLYPDGRLQEAGGIVWGSGNPWNYGRGANPADPRFSYTRQADFVSGAALMLPRQVWDEVGGLSDEFAPAYFEDTDLAFKVRDAGYTTWVVPASEVYHFEGVSNGTDVTTTSGLKRFQEVNRPKFKQKWARAVVHNGVEGENPDLVKDRGVSGRILFIDHAVPRPDRDAGGYATTQEMLLVQSLGFKVTFAAINVAYMGHYSDDLNKYGIETIHAPFALSIKDFLEQRGREFDAVYITRYNVAQQVTADVRQHAPQAKIMFNNCDLHFLRELRVALASKAPEDLERAVQIRDQELAVMRDVDVVLSYNEVEHSVILSHNLTSSTVVKCPWVVETVPESDVPPFESREGIAFLGSYMHPPNLEAVEYFIAEVLPTLRKQLPDVKFNIYGSNMPDRLSLMADDVINPVGFVKTVDEVYDNNRVFVAPLLTGAGMKGKVLGALAHGIPSVLSAIAAEGTGARDGVDALMAKDADEWVDGVVRLYKDAELWTRMSNNSRLLTEKHYSFDTGRHMMRDALSTVGLYGARS